MQCIYISRQLFRALQASKELPGDGKHTRESTTAITTDMRSGAAHASWLDTDGRTRTECGIADAGGCSMVSDTDG